jgi:large subunit ribosomal protein L22
MVRRLSVPDALLLLEKLPKKGAILLHGVIASAAANAENGAGQRADALFIKELIVNKGASFRRFIPAARGRARPIDKFSSHITVELGVLLPKGMKDDEKKTTKKSSAAKTPKKTKLEKAQKEKRAAENIEIVEKVDLRHGTASSTKKDATLEADPHAPHSKGPAGDIPDAPTFQPHRQGGRGV